MRRGRQPQNIKTGCGIAESGNRLAPIFPLAEGAALFPRDPFTIFHQPRTLPAANNLGVQNFKRLFGHRFVFGSLFPSAGHSVNLIICGTSVPP